MFDSPLIPSAHPKEKKAKRNQKPDNDAHMEEQPVRCYKTVCACRPKFLAYEYECNTDEAMRPLILCRLRIQAGD